MSHPYAIGLILKDRWSIFYGNAEKVQSFIMKHKRGFVKYYHDEDGMNRQLDYYKSEMDIEEIHMM